MERAPPAEGNICIFQKQPPPLPHIRPIPFRLTSFTVECSNSCLQGHLCETTTVCVHRKRQGSEKSIFQGRRNKINTNFFGPDFLRTFLTLTPGCPGVKKFLPTTSAAGKHTLITGKKKAYTAPEKWGPQRKGFGGTFGFCRFYRVFVSTPWRAKPCFSKPRFSRKFLHPLRCAPRTHSGSKTAWFPRALSLPGEGLQRCLRRICSELLKQKNRVWKRGFDSAGSCFS